MVDYTKQINDIEEYLKQHITSKYCRDETIKYISRKINEILTIAIIDRISDRFLLGYDTERECVHDIDD